MKPAISTLLLLLTILLVNCSDNNIAGTETGNPTEVTGIVSQGDGSLVPGALVRLISTDFNPLSADSTYFSATAVTDETGSYHFNDIPDGSYSDRVQPITFQAYSY